MIGNTYELGDLIQVQSAFVIFGTTTPVDPSGVTLIVEDPDGNKTTYTIGQLLHLSVGVFALQFVVSVSGPWIYKFVGSGSVQVSTPDGYFTVNQSAVLPG